MKQVTIIGNLGANAVRRMTSDGRELMTFNVAVNAAKNETVWFNCVGTLREKLFAYLLKGQCVCVTGDISASDYMGRVDLTVNIDRVELCGKAPEQATQEQPMSPEQATQEKQIAQVASFDADQQQTF